MENTNKFAEGLRVTKPKEGTPSFVIAKLGINVAPFIKYLQDNANGNGFVDLDVLQSKAGDKYYAVKNEWVPEKKEAVADATFRVDAPADDSINPDDIPF